MLDEDKMPKVKPNQGTYEELTAKSVILLPDNQVKPVNQRIFAISQDPGEMKTEAGIILATSFNSPNAKEESRRRYILRYFAVDVADDCDLKVWDFDHYRKLERGDEIFPFIPADADSFSWPTVFDFYVNKEYLVFHQTELAGIGNSLSLKKE